MKISGLCLQPESKSRWTLWVPPCTRACCLGSCSTSLSPAPAPQHRQMLKCVPGPGPQTLHITTALGFFSYEIGWHCRAVPSHMGEDATAHVHTVFAEQRFPPAQHWDEFISFPRETWATSVWWCRQRGELLPQGHCCGRDCEQYVLPQELHCWFFAYCSFLLHDQVGHICSLSVGEVDTDHRRSEFIRECIWPHPWTSDDEKMHRNISSPHFSFCFTWQLFISWSSPE